MSGAEGLYQRSPPWVQNVLLNLHASRIMLHRYDRPYRRAVAGLVAQERWDRQRIEATQLEALQRVVRHAYESSPYYRRTMDERGLTPSDLKDLRDLSRWPLLDKTMVRERASGILTARKPRNGWIHGHTSGTTGSPLGLWYNRDACRFNNAVDRQFKIRAGVGETDWIGFLLGRVVVPIQTTRAPFWRVNRVQRQIWFSSFHLADRYLEHYIREIDQRKLRFLEGYPSTLYVLARYLLERGRVLPMQAVISSSETHHQLQREAIEAAFQCKLYDFYALAERVIFAGECGHGGGKHLAETYGLTEIPREPSGKFRWVISRVQHAGTLPWDDQR